MMKNIACVCVLIFIVFCSFGQKMSLAGTWRISLDSADGQAHSIQLPGTLDDANIGEPVNIPSKLDIATLAHLQRKVQYVGKAYYQRDIVIPANWKEKSITLSLERVLWQSKIFIDGKPLQAIEESLTTSHVYDLSGVLLPGKKHRLTICIDNSNIYPGINIYASQYPSKESAEMAHSYTNHTQIKWNGILGQILIETRPTVHLQNVVITPDFNTKQITLDYHLQNQQHEKVSLRSFVKSHDGQERLIPLAPASRFSDENFSIKINTPAILKSWSEFNPHVYDLVTIINSARGIDTLITQFGIRNLHTRNGNLFLDSNRIFIRGNLECVIFPLKGYTPTLEKDWLDLLRKAKTYGINTFRFHSWCPPESAFAAADRLGFYFQIELPHWNLKVGTDTAAFRFLHTEARRILQAYGNHPSFLFFSMGNELEGDFAKLNSLVAELKQLDSRHLYSTTTFTFQRGISGIPQPQDDYFVTQQTKDGWVRGQGIFNSEKPDFTKDYNSALKEIKIPLISHEIGQYAVFPDINEIGEYTGNLRPANLIAIRDDLKKRNLLAHAPSFLAASGKLAALLYKEEIERVLKTKDMDGFQLLQLQDFPGQGTALVGLLNAFWKSKGVITPEKFKSFCNEVTPLLRFPKAEYSNTEIFLADVELANFFKTFSAPVHWEIRNEKILASGVFAERIYPVDNGLKTGTIKFNLKSVTKASKLTVTVSVPGTAFRNEWNIWVYPKNLVTEPGGLIITSSMKEAFTALDAGKKVLLCPSPEKLRGIAGSFVPVFWSPVHFPDKAGTMGLLIKKDHKAMANFPTDFHTNWQWWDLVIKSKAVELPSLSDSAFIVRAIDNFVGNRNLAYVFEARVGNGSMIFCSMDIVNNLDQRLEAGQLKYSLISYMKSSSFSPKVRLSQEALSKLFK